MRCLCSRSSNVYSGPITVSSSETLNALAVTSGGFFTAIATAPYTITDAAPTIDYTSGFNATNLDLDYDIAIVSGSLQLSAGNVHQMGTAWYATPVNVQAFTSDFNYQANSPVADGITFAIQNSSAGIWALGGDGDNLGYGGIDTSAAIKFDFYNNAGEGTDSTGFYTNGASPIIPALDMTASGVILRSGDLMHVHITYNGTTLTWTITDTVTNATFTASAVANIPAIVGGNTAYVGLTGSTGTYTSTQYVSDWTYISGCLLYTSRCV